MCDLHINTNWPGVVLAPVPVGKASVAVIALNNRTES